MRRFYIAAALSACIIATIPAGAQSLKSITKVVNAAAGHLRGLDLTGTWEYSGSSVAFESDNLLKKAGGAVAANKIERNIDSHLSKVGFTPGVTSFTFNDDGTFANNLNGRTVRGTYEYDSDDGYLTLKYANHLPVKARMTGSGNNVSLMFESGGFLSLVSFMGSHSGSSILGGVSSIADSYDGMLMGLELHRQ